VCGRRRRAHFDFPDANVAQAIDEVSIKYVFGHLQSFGSDGIGAVSPVLLRVKASAKRFTRQAGSGPSGLGD